MCCRATVRLLFFANSCLYLVHTCVCEEQWMFFLVRIFGFLFINRALNHTLNFLFLLFRHIDCAFTIKHTFIPQCVFIWLVLLLLEFFSSIIVCFTSTLFLFVYSFDQFWFDFFVAIYVSKQLLLQYVLRSFFFLDFWLGFCLISLNDKRIPKPTQKMTNSEMCKHNVLVLVNFSAHFFAIRLFFGERKKNRLVTLEYIAIV